MNEPFGHKTQDPAIRASVESVLREYGPMTIAELEVALDLSRTVVETALRHLRTAKPVVIKLRVHYQYVPPPAPEAHDGTPVDADRGAGVVGDDPRRDDPA